MTDQEASEPPDTPSTPNQPARVVGGINRIKIYFQERRAKKKQENATDRAARSTARATWAIAVLTLVTIAVGVSQYITFDRQLTVMKSQLDVMEADKRPWVKIDIEPGGPVSIKDGNIAVKITLMNVGSSPALNAMAWLAVFPSGLAEINGPYTARANRLINNRGPACNEASPIAHFNQIVGDTLFPNEPLVRTYGVEINAKEIDDARRRPGSGNVVHLAIVGCVEYKYGPRIYKTVRSYSVFPRGDYVVINPDAAPLQIGEFTFEEVPGGYAQ